MFWSVLIDTMTFRSKIHKKLGARCKFRNGTLTFKIQTPGKIYKRKKPRPLRNPRSDTRFFNPQVRFTKNGRQKKGGYPYFLLLQGSTFPPLILSSGVHISYNILGSGVHNSYNNSRFCLQGTIFPTTFQKIAQYYLT